MREKLTYEEVKIYVEELGYKLISNEYKKKSQKIILKDKNGYYFISTFNSFKIGKTLRIVDTRNPYSLQNIKLWCKINNKPFELLSKEYTNAHKNLKWKCLKEECGEEFEANWSNIYFKGSNCSYCVGRKVGLSNCLATKRPDLAKEWFQEMNEDLTPYDVTCNSHKKVWWKCNNGHKWKTTVAHRNEGNNCPYCVGKLPTKENNLSTDNPELCKEWNYDKNDKKPENYTPNSGAKVWWKCSKNHEWEASIYSRNLGRGCPYCSNLLPTKENNLLTTNPKLCEEWDYNKNINNPEKYLPNSRKKVWWICKNGHEWFSCIYHRNNGIGCPYCHNKLGLKYPSKDYNLLIDNPELCEEWDYDKNNKKPEEYTPFSKSKVWWICKKCGHGWSASINNRNKKRGCPLCNKSKGEQECKRVLDSKNIIFEEEYDKFRDLLSDLGNPLRFDFAILDKDKNIIGLIEYDGEFHYKKLYKEQNFETSKYHDQLKNEYCAKHNIPLLRIPYWEFENIENILNNWLFNLI